MVRIGNLEIKGKAVLAPMAGVADRAFREICIGEGAAYVVGEMASAKGLCFQSTKTEELLGVTDGERPMAVQLFGDDPVTMAKAANIAAEFRPDVIDINMGCPAPKIAGGGSGSALHKNLPLAGKIIEAVVQAVDIPVTVKMRKGWDDSVVNAVELARIAEEAGAAAVTVHGRTRVQMYAPPVDLDIIAAVKQAVSVPVIGNGDVTDVDSAIQMLEHTGCDLVMIGRGALGHPWVFRQIDTWFGRGERLADPPMEERMGLLLRQAALACEYKGEYKAMREARTHAAWYLKGMRGAAALRARAGQLAAYADLEQLVQSVLELA